ncbi:HNH endonuclease [Bauldia litoralis]|uniref:HNH endonuclease n=1 Tax=Bauldia litoralis TaxID=665467 RepID=UPI0032642FFA
MGVSFRGPSRRVTKTRRWKALRLEALRRDGFQCGECSAPANEVDHIRPVRDAPELAYDLENLQSLCGSCHSRKTIAEVGLASFDTPARAAWRDLVRTMRPQPQKEEMQCSNP